jgi:glycosyltransferase involved in cell wall biosynthesis
MQTVDDSLLWEKVRKQVVNFPVSSNVDPLQSLRMAVRFKSLSYARWIGAALEEAQRIQGERRFDVVYSRSLPMFGHIAGYWCAKYLGLPWIANVNDPWDWHLFPVRLVNKKRIPNVISSLWMKKTFRSADLVTYPSQRLHAYHEKISGIRHSALVIPHVGTAPQKDSPTGQPSDTFTLVHAGKLGLNEATGRSAVPLLRGLRLFFQDFPEAAAVTRLVFVGPSDGAMESLASELHLTANVSSVGRVTYEQSLEFIRGATVCVLVEAEMPEGIFLPSKLVDYLSARKPVLALSPRAGVVNDMAERFGILRVDTGDVEGVRRTIGSLYGDFRNRTLSLRGPAQEQVSQFEPKNLAATFLAAVRGLAQSKQMRSTSRSDYKIGTETTPDMLVK